MFHQVPCTNSVNLIKNASEAKLVLFYKRTLIKINKCNNHLWFLTMCIKHNLVPKHMKIICKNNSKEAQYAVDKTYKIWLRGEQKSMYSRRDNLYLHLKLIHTTLHSEIPNIIFDIIDVESREEANIISHEHYSRLNQKILSLRKIQSTHHTENNSFQKCEHQFFRRVENLSQVQIEDRHLNILNKGLKYCPDIKSKKDIELLAINTEIALNSENSENTTIQKTKCAKIIKETLTSVKNSKEQRIISELKEVIKNNDLIITKADKGNTVTIIEKSKYTDKVYDLLNTDNFTQINTDPTNKYQLQLKTTIKNCRNILENIPSYTLHVMNPRPPILYGLPKLHKDNIPIRPVVSYINAPTYKLCQKLNKILPTVINLKNNYSIKNTSQFIERVKNINLPDNACLVSFDVKNLFTSIPTDELLLKVNELINNSDNLNQTEKNELLALIKTCLNQNYFMFNSKFYKQTDGLPMGSPLSPLMAEIFMNCFEEELFTSEHTLTSLVQFWSRYVDDVFCVWLGDDEQLNQFLMYLNSFNQKIQFTMEAGKDQLNYLDLSIKKHRNKLEFEIYRKPTQTDTIIPADANQSIQAKYSAFHSLIHRLFNVPLSPENYKKEVDVIKTVAFNNGYDPTLIDHLITKKQNKAIMKNFYPEACYKDKKSKWYFINYQRGLSEKINDIIHKSNINTISVNKNNLGKYLANNKEKIEDHKKSGVYELTCSECDAIYIGQTGRNVGVRVKEHKNSIRDIKRVTGIAEHCIDNCHMINTTSVKILHVEEKGKRLDLLEQLEIMKAINHNKNITNDKSVVQPSHILKALI